jgi:hypothetical protein
LYTLLLRYPQKKKSQALRSGIFQAIQYSLFVRSRELATSRWGVTLQSSQCEPLLSCWNLRVWVSTPHLCNSGSRNVWSISV